MTETKESKVTFYAVGRKFIESKKSPPKSEQLVFYSLAIGHHVGIIDCLEPKLTLPTDGYVAWIDHLPKDGEAYSKLQHLMKFGEITIDSSHIDMLAFALDKAMPEMNEQEKKWSKDLIALFATIKAEPAIYLTVKKSDG